MFELVLRIGFSLLVVLGLMWGIAKVMRRPLAGRAGSALTVLSRQQLSRGSSVAVVQVVDRALVIGITENQVTLLGEADLAAFQRPDDAPAPKRDAVQLDTILGRKALNPSQSPDLPGRLDGSLLSVRTWKATVNFLRDRTLRR